MLIRTPSSSAFEFLQGGADDELGRRHFRGNFGFGEAEGEERFALGGDYFTGQSYHRADHGNLLRDHGVGRHVQSAGEHLQRTAQPADHAVVVIPLGREGPGECRLVPGRDGGHR